jgi:hypothetical protein
VHWHNLSRWDLAFQAIFVLYIFTRWRSRHRPQGLVTIFFYPSTTLKKTQGRNLKCQTFIQHFFKIVLYWCLDLIRHNIAIIGTHLKLNKCIFDISIPFCHHLYLSATLKQCFTECAVCRTTFHHVDMSVRGRIPTCDLIGQLFLGSCLKISTFFAILTLKITNQSNRT